MSNNQNTPWTPGPYRQFARSVLDNDNIQLAMCPHGPRAEDNARLFAAAPEMAEAMAELLRTFPRYNRDHYPDIAAVHDKARALLALIRGETP